MRYRSLFSQPQDPAYNTQQTLVASAAPPRVKLGRKTATSSSRSHRAPSPPSPRNIAPDPAPSKPRSKLRPLQAEAGPSRNTRARSRPIEPVDAASARPKRKGKHQQDDQHERMEPMVEQDFPVLPEPFDEEELAEQEELVAQLLMNTSNETIGPIPSRKRSRSVSSSDEETERRLSAPGRAPFKSSDMNADARAFMQESPVREKKAKSVTDPRPRRPLQLPPAGSPFMSLNRRQPDAQSTPTRLLRPQAIVPLPAPVTPQRASLSSDASFPLHGTLARSVKKKRKSDHYDPPPTSRAARLKRRRGDD